MHYHDGSPAKLGDVVAIAMPGGIAKARVVMLGDSMEHLDIDANLFSGWKVRSC